MRLPGLSAVAAALLAVGPATGAQEYPSTVDTAPSALQAEERILDFNSLVAIQKNGSLDVTERIRVNALNNEINHGIYRDFPTRYDVPNGGRVKVGFTFKAAELDGRTVESDVSSMSNGVRIRLGSADTIVAVGIHDYVIRYQVTRELGFFSDYDELYWNVTGNGWSFPIDKARLTATLPAPVEFGQRAFYTGSQGSTDANAAVVAEGPGSIAVETTQPLGPYQGLTVAIAFPKGVVDAPGKGQKLAWWVTDMLPVALAAFTVLAVIGFLIFAHARAGRDPRAGTVVPLFAPSDDLSPAAMRYVSRQGFDNRAFAAALVEAGVKGHVRLGEDKGVLFFGGKKYIEGLPGGGREALQPAEAAAIASLVGSGERLDFDNANHATFSAARTALSDDFARRFDGVLFKHNRGWTGAALGLWLLGAYLTALALVFAEGPLPAPFALATPVVGVAAFLLWRIGGKMVTIGSCLFRLAGFLLALVACGLAMTTIAMALGTGRWEPIVLAMTGLPIALSSLLWISAPTKEGRAVLDRIAGFRQYLSITERDRLDRMQAPADTLNLFERYLPYAIALDVENRWADRFASQLAAAAAAGGQGFGWYAGSHSPWTDTGGFVNSIGSSLSSSISSASTAPGSSSGSGGGGSSGGGGGGGGGGGW